MIQDFDVPVRYQVKERLLPAASQASRFSRHFHVNLYDPETLFETNGEGTIALLLIRR